MLKKTLTEVQFYNIKVLPFFKRLGCLVERFEQKSIPDVYVSRNDYALWCELKCINKRKKKAFDPGWRPGQLARYLEHKRVKSNNVCLLLWYCGEMFFLEPKSEYTEEDLICQKQIFLKKILQKTL